MTYLSVSKKWRTAIFLFALLSGPLAACGEADNHVDHDHGHGDEEFVRGPNGGRLLEDGRFALEVTIFEQGRPPQFRVYAYRNDRPVDAETVKLEIGLDRLGGVQDRFMFKTEGDYLASQGIVSEPHSFDVSVSAKFEGANYEWAYPSYEGRTEISDEAAHDAGVTTATAGPAEIVETIDVLGRVKFAPGAQARLQARFPGVVLDVDRTVGDRVVAGDVLARVESNESLRTYEIKSPISGVVLERNANPGDIAGDAPLFVIGDLKRLLVDFHIFASDLPRVKSGQDVFISSVDGVGQGAAKIDALLPTQETATQTIVARATLDNEDSVWIPGMTVGGDIVVKNELVPLAVRTPALQRFRDFTVVFAKVGHEYEVRMLRLGRQTPEWTEVLDGVRPGEEYVVANSYLIKADIEKSGASHDH
jgi:cobalt-zinc-cadmium efflux system membrane fusion protein